MGWENILKTSSLSTMHFRNLKKAVTELSDTHSDLLENAGTYKNEIIELASKMYNKEIGETSKVKIGNTKTKYKAKFRNVINRVVNSIKKERGIK